MASAPLERPCIMPNDASAPARRRAAFFLSRTHIDCKTLVDYRLLCCLDPASCKVKIGQLTNSREMRMDNRATDRDGASTVPQSVSRRTFLSTGAAGAAALASA